MHHRVGWLGIVILMFPILGWVWLVAREPVQWVFSGGVFVCMGKIFTEPFDIINAGFSLDQPTIGKWLFWFTFMTVSALPYSLFIRWLSDRTKASAYIVYAVFSVVLGIFLLCILSFPFLMLVQYVYSMGTTLRRIQGLFYAVAGGILIVGFIVVAFRKPKDMSENTIRHVAVRLCAPSVFAIIPCVLVVLVNFQTWTAQYYCLKMIDHEQMIQECIKLLRTTQFSDEIKTVTYLPKKNWASLPSGLRKLNLELISIQKQSVVLRKGNAAIFVFMPRESNSNRWDLVFHGYSPLYNIEKKILTIEPQL